MQSDTRRRADGARGTAVRRFRRSNLIAFGKKHLQNVKRQHEWGVADGLGRVVLPVALASGRIRSLTVSCHVGDEFGRVARSSDSCSRPQLSRCLAGDHIQAWRSIRDKSQLLWTDLYRLFEVVVDGAGGIDVIVTDGWASRTQLRRFKHSANSVKAAGDQARHGVEPTTPPPDAMTISEARALLDILWRDGLGKALSNSNWSRRRGLSLACRGSALT